MSKPKIDLKARLGRRAGAPPVGASIPPPVGVNPQPSQHPGQQYPGQQHPGQHPGQMAPQGGYAQPQPAPRASYDPMAMGQGMPMGQMHAPAPVRVAATAAFEIDDEGFQAVQRGKGRKVIVLAGLAALVGLGIGYGIGGMSERNKVAEAAVVGAKALMVDIDKANAEAVQLQQVLEAAGKALGEGKYPDEQVSALGGLRVSFDGTNLSNKSIGRFRPQLLTQLITYTETASKVNTQKDKLRSLLSFSKKGVEELLDQRKNPTFRWGVSVQSSEQGPVATMQVLPSAFAVNEKAWPATLGTMKRYTGGDPTKGADGAFVIPVAPGTQNNVCPTDTIIRLRRELGDMQKAIKGDTSPGEETEGIVQLGENIKKQLAAIGGSAPAEAAAAAPAAGG